MFSGTDNSWNCILGISKTVHLKTPRVYQWGDKGPWCHHFLSGQVHRYELEWISSMVEFLDLLHKLYYRPHEAV